MPNRSTVSRLFTRKDALDQSRLVQQEESLDATEGEIVLRLDLFSLTTNNITYAPSATPCGTGNSSPPAKTSGA